MFGFCEFLHPLVALGGAFLGRVIQVLADFVLVHLHKRVHSVLHAPLDEEELPDGGVKDVFLDTEEEECPAAVRVKQRAVQPLEGRVVRDAGVDEAQVALSVADLRGDAFALGKVGDGPVVHPQARHRAAFII